MVLEKEKEAEKSRTLGKIKELQEDLKQALVQYHDMAKKEMKFTEMQCEVLAVGKKYDEVINFFKFYSS